MMQTMMLAIIRSDLGRDTTFLTTNYDTYLEERYEKLSAVFAGSDTMPGLRVRLAGEESAVRVVPPRNIEPNVPGAYIDIVYLHGRLPPVGLYGNANWPLVLDENSYAATARRSRLRFGGTYSMHPWRSCSARVSATSRSSAR